MIHRPPTVVAFQNLNGVRFVFEVLNARLASLLPASRCIKASSLARLLRQSVAHYVMFFTSRLDRAVFLSATVGSALWQAAQLLPRSCPEIWVEDAVRKLQRSICA